ncbi:MAG: hypothetical protein U1E45_21040 [Geminicoccaceae bacterium]
MTGRTETAAERRERLAQELRANLKRRKAQARARSDGGEGAAGGKADEGGPPVIEEGGPIR